MLLSKFWCHLCKVSVVLFPRGFKMFVFFLIHVCVGSSCCTRVTKHLKKAYSSLFDAYGMDYFEMPVTSTTQTPKNSQWQDQPLSPIFDHSPSVKSHLEGNVCIGDIVVKLVLMFKTAMTKRMQLQLSPTCSRCLLRAHMD